MKAVVFFVPRFNFTNTLLCWKALSNPLGCVLYSMKRTVLQFSKHISIASLLLLVCCGFFLMMCHGVNNLSHHKSGVLRSCLSLQHFVDNNLDFKEPLEAWNNYFTAACGSFFFHPFFQFKFILTVSLFVIFSCGTVCDNC